MAFCMNCGTQLPETAKFCNKCGTPTGAAPAMSAPAENAVPDNQHDALNKAIRSASNYLNDNIPQGSKTVILVQAGTKKLSDYTVDRFIANAANDGKFAAADRKQLDLIRTQMNLQVSGEIDGKRALEAGSLSGAQTIVTVMMRRLDEVDDDHDRYRMKISVLDAQTAQVRGMYSGDMTISHELSWL